MIVKTGVAAEKMGEWKQLCGNMVALIDYVSEEYLRALSDSAVKCVVATTADDLLQYHRVNPLLRVSVRLSLSGEMYDSGISVEEAPAFFEVAKSNGIEARVFPSLHA